MSKVLSRSLGLIRAPVPTAATRSKTSTEPPGREREIKAAVKALTKRLIRHRVIHLVTQQ